MFVPRNAKKAAGPVQDPTFKDFTYYCQDPNSLVDATSLVDELHKPNAMDAGGDCDGTANGTPLSSFIANESTSDSRLGRSPDIFPVDPRLNPPYNSKMPLEVEERKKTPPPPPLYVPPPRNPLPPKPAVRTPSPNASTDSTTEEKDDAVRRNAATAPVFFRNSFRHSFRAPSD
ncbi:hypothetical protein B5M09_003506 [Aphanomyces astaci]|nr:hypothetical protein B5M09_003506 [Aphanomyces astaci]